MSLRLIAIGSAVFLSFIGMVGVVRAPNFPVTAQMQASLLALDDTGEGDLGIDSAGGGGFKQKQGSIDLLTNIGGKTSVSGEIPIYTYLEGIGPWLAQIVVGICVIWVLIAGFEIMLSGSKATSHESGVNHMRWALIGLCIAMFSGLILKLLNNMYYK